jgi:hypothetical protein
MKTYVVVSDGANGPVVLTARDSKRGAEAVALKLSQSVTQRHRRVYAEERNDFWVRVHGKRWVDVMNSDMTNSVGPSERY